MRKMSSRIRILGFVLCLELIATSVAMVRSHADQTRLIKWTDILKQQPEWYGSAAAVHIADNVLQFQRDSGGWPKNIDMAKPLTDSEAASVARQKQENDSNIDNSATYTQLIFLAKVYQAKQLERHKEAFLKGVDYLLNAQYDNGGWPQF